MCHPELVEGSLYEYRHYYHRDPSTPLRYAQDDGKEARGYAQDDGKEARGFAQDDVRYFLSYNQITRGKMTLLPKNFSIIKLRIRKPRFSVSAPKLSHTCDSIRKE